MSKQYTREEIYTKLLEILVEDFEISKDIITPNANLFDDLELDSIDAVDLAVKLQTFTNKKITPENLSNVLRINNKIRRKIQE